MPRRRSLLFLALLFQAGSHLSAQAIDRDLLEVTIPRLEELYASRRYTVTQVVQWYLARISKYDRIYRAVCAVDTQGALATAAHEDADAARGVHDGAMW